MAKAKAGSGRGGIWENSPGIRRLDAGGRRPRLLYSVLAYDLGI
jgi:hypothetical protein